MSYESIEVIVIPIVTSFIHRRKDSNRKRPKLKWKFICFVQRWFVVLVVDSGEQLRTQQAATTIQDPEGFTPATGRANLVVESGTYYQSSSVAKSGMGGWTETK